MFRTEHQRRAENTLRDIQRLQQYLVTGAGTTRCPDLDALLGLAAKEAARWLVHEGNVADFAVAAAVGQEDRS
jgi:hypothetical protein